MNATKFDYLITNWSIFFKNNFRKSVTGKLLVFAFSKSKKLVDRRDIDIS
jgi:hypothetical protein